MEVNTLNCLKQVLDDFGRLSGLECNVEKTTIMQVGTDGPIPREILEIGFSAVREVMVLGCTLSGPGADRSGNLENIFKNLQKQVNHWACFNLSLPGHISVNKTMLYSQINYLGCFLPITDYKLRDYSQILEKFVVGKLNITRNRITKPIRHGGLGLFDLKIFLDVQKITWVKRAKSVDEWWKKALYSKCYNVIFNIRSTDFDPRSEPCLHSIVTSYERFLVNYTKLSENYKDSYIFDNNVLTLGLRDNRKLDKSIFTAGFLMAYGEKIKNKLKLVIYYAMGIHRFTGMNLVYIQIFQCRS
jgi:hypothetical protein